MNQAIKGNKPLRFFAMAMILLLVVAHFMDQVDLTEVSFLWLMILMALNAIQASFSGVCPMFKNARGECVACGVVCDPAQAKGANAQKTEGGCCSSGSASSSCCDSGSEKSTCCSGDDESESKSAESSVCCGSEAESDACGGTNCVGIKVLGTGCATCNNTVKQIQAVADQLGVCVCIEKVEDVAEIAAYGVMSTPGIVIGEQVVHSGGIPAPSQVEEWLKEN